MTCTCGSVVTEERGELGLETCKDCAKDSPVFGVPEFDGEGCIVGLAITEDREAVRKFKADMSLIVCEAISKRRPAKRGRNLRSSPLPSRPRGPEFRTKPGE